VKLATVIIFVRDLDRMRAFYETLLGLVVVEESPGWVRFSTGTSALALHALAHADAPTSPREDSYIKVAFHADDVATERARLAAAGVVVRDPVTFGSITLCDAVDPEGNVFQISSRPLV
jgi:catechol 2,3-dioxygenase-like lactoylglutathione lyase family enzyme